MALNTSHVKRGNWGEFWLDGRKFTNVRSVKWNMKATKEKIPQVDSLSDAELQNGLEKSGEIKFTKTDSYMLKQLVTALKTGKIQNFTIITSQSSDAEHKDCEKVKLTGCSFDEVGSEWEAGKISEESYPFTYTDIEPITWAQDD